MAPRIAIPVLVMSILFGTAMPAHPATGERSNMMLLGHRAIGSVYESDVVGTVAYWGNGAYLEIHTDFANPAAPVKLGRVLVPGPIMGVDVEGGYAYVADSDDGLRIIDVSNPATAYEVGFLDTPGTAQDVKVFFRLFNTVQTIPRPANNPVMKRAIKLKEPSASPA